MIRRLIILLLIVGCSTMRNMYHKNFKLDKSTAYFKIGMTEEEFIRKNPDITEKLNESDEFTTYINSEQPYKYIVLRITFRTFFSKINNIIFFLFNKF